jgi:lysophospholipase L1-like esterase
VRSRGRTALAAGATIFLLAVLAASASPAPSRAPLRLVALGDATAYGRYLCGNCSTFVRQFAEALARSTHRDVRLSNLARSTLLDSDALRTLLASDPKVRARVARANAVTITVGHDDKPWVSTTDSCDGPVTYPATNWSVFDEQCLGDNVDHYEANLGAILTLVRRLRHGRQTLIRLTIDYNDLIGRRGLSRRGVDVSQELGEYYAFATCEAALRFRADCIDVLHAFNGESGFQAAGRFLARDHAHPNARGHREIARLMIRDGFGPFRRR